MPQFKSYEGQPIRHDLLGAYISGRAQKLAYEHDKARKDLIDEQLAQLAFQNSPEGRQMAQEDRQMKIDEHTIARNRALREERKEKRLQQAHNRDEVLVDADGGYTTITYDDEGTATVTQEGQFTSTKYNKTRKFQSLDGTWMQQDINQNNGRPTGVPYPLYKQQGAEKLTERQGKAYAWNESFTLGSSQMEKLLELNYRPSAFALIKYGIFKSDSSSEFAKVSARKLISVADMEWFDAAYRMIEPKLRQSSGAAIRPSEIDAEFSAMIPMTMDKGEMSSKKLYRQAVHRGIRLEMQGGTAPGKVAIPTGRTATNAAGDKLQEMSDGSWKPM